MNWLALVQVALRALLVHRLRSGLTILGIVIGVAALVTMIAVGDGAQTHIAERINSLGANLLLLQPGSLNARGVRLGAGSEATLTEEDAYAIEREVTEAVVAGPGVAEKKQIVYGNQNWSTVITGVTPAFHIAREWEVSLGRSLSIDDVIHAEKVAVIGSTVTDKLFGKANPIGLPIRVGKVPFTVIGILATKGESAGGTDQDDIILIPLSTARIRVVGSTHANRHAVQFIVVKVYAEAAMAATEQRVRELLRQRHHLQPGDPDDFHLRNLADIMKTRQETSRVFNLMLASVASVSLIVGGISIMNIMLVSVTERTREIGLRLAIGARRRDVRNQFLIEALTLSLIGGFIGLTLGVAGAVIIASLAGWPVLLRIETIILAFCFAALVGVFFGYYPASKASRLNPIDALRFE